MTEKTITGIVSWLKGWFYDKTEITGFLNNKANQSDLNTTNGNLATLSSVVENKVDKVTGKGLSTEDFTTALKDKLNGIESEANKTVVDSALSSTSENPVQNKIINTALSGKAPTSHASSATTYGVGTTSNYGHVKTINALTQSSHTNGTALSAYQGKVLKDMIDDVSGDIPTKTSELTNDSGFLTSHQDISGKEDKSNKVASWSSTTNNTNYPGEKLVKDSLDTKLNISDAFSGSYNDLTNVPSTFTPSEHTHSTRSTDILTEEDYPNIGVSSGDKLISLFEGIDTALGNLSSIRAIEVVSTKPTASASTMGKLYIVEESNKINVYYTEQDGSTYSWHKMDTDILDELSVDWSDITNKPSSFTPSSHTHGHISNDGKISQGRAQTNYISNVPIVADASSKELYYGFIATARSIEPNALANIGTSANEYQSNINSAINDTIGDINTSLNSRGAMTDDIDWSYNSNDFVNGIKLVPKASDDTGAIIFHLKT